MKLQQRSIAYKFPSIKDITAIILYWEFYIDEDDFPNNPEIRKRWLSIHVKQHQFLRDEKEGKYNTIFFGHKGKPWDHRVNDNNKQLIIQKIEEFMQSYEDPYTGKINESLIAKYKMGNNDTTLTMRDNVKYV